MEQPRIYRATTPTVTLDVDEDISGWDVHIYARNGGTVMEFSGDRVTKSATDAGSSISVTLTEDETRGLAADANLAVQLRAKSGLTIVASSMALISVGDVIEDGDI